MRHSRDQQRGYKPLSRAIVTVLAVLLNATVALVAGATAGAQSATAPNADETQIRAMVKSIYARYNRPIPEMGPTPSYSPSTAALYERYQDLTKDEPVSGLGFDHYCECQDFDEKASRLLGVTIARVAPGLIDATAEYVLFRGGEATKTRIRFAKSDSWKVHDIFWANGGTFRSMLTAEVAQLSSAAKPSGSVAQPSVAERTALAQPKAAQSPVPVAMPAQSVSVCGGNPRCAEVSAFAATVTNLRESATGGSEPYRVVSVTVRFQNLTAAPLFLGYVTGSGVVTDDRGNRYSLGRYQGSVVRGIGELGTSGSIDPKFALRAGESGDARFEFMWFPGKAIIGTRLVVDLTVREIESFPGNQWQLGREHALQFRGFGEPGAPAGMTAAAAPPPVAPATASTNDVCANRPECFSAGPFLAEITRLSTSQPAQGYRAIQFSVRFRNLTQQPLVLAHTTSSTLIVDDQGNRYTPTWALITEVRGMGSARGMQSDPSFVLQPGAAREATFQVQIGNTGKVRLGTTYNVDFAVEELEVFPGNQVRSARQFAVGFHDVKTKTGGWSALRGLINIEVKTK